MIRGLFLFLLDLKQEDKICTCFTEFLNTCEYYSVLQRMFWKTYGKTLEMGLAINTSTPDCTS